MSPSFMGLKRVSSLTKGSQNMESLKRSNSTGTQSSEESVIKRSNSYEHSSSTLDSIEEDLNDKVNFDSPEEVEVEYDDEMDYDPDIPEPPLSPPKELHPGRLYALYEFSGPDPSQCDLEYDDAVILLNDDDSYWWLIKKIKDGQIGFAPAECLETHGERLARLNCWKNEELERISKEESKKKSRSLLNLSRKTSTKFSSGGSSSSLLRKKSTRSVSFSDSLQYSEPAYISDTESEEYYSEDYDDVEDDGRELDIDTVQPAGIDIDDIDEELDNLDNDDDTLSGDASPVQSSPVHVTEDLGDVSDVEVDVSPLSPKKRVSSTESHQPNVGNKYGTHTANTAAAAAASGAAATTAALSMANNVKQNTLSVQNASDNHESDGGSARNSNVSISDDDASLLNRSSSMYSKQDIDAAVAAATPVAETVTEPVQETKSVLKTVASNYSIGEYSPSSSEFESDTQTPTKLTVLNSLSLGSKLSNSNLNSASTTATTSFKTSLTFLNNGSNSHLNSVSMSSFGSANQTVTMESDKEDNDGDDTEDEHTETGSTGDKSAVLVDETAQTSINSPVTVPPVETKLASPLKVSKTSPIELEETEVGLRDVPDSARSSNEVISVTSAAVSTGAAGAVAATSSMFTSSAHSSAFSSASSLHTQKKEAAHTDDSSNSSTLTPPATDSESMRNSNDSFSSILDDYHPEIKNIFLPLFNKVDLLSSKLEELEKSLI